MSKVFPGEPLEGESAGEREENKVNETQAKKYLEQAEDDPDSKIDDGRKSAWGSPRSKTEGDEDHDSRRKPRDEENHGEERKHRHHHRHHREKEKSDSHSSGHKHKERKNREHHSHRKPDSDSDDSSRATDPSKPKDLELGGTENEVNEPPPPLEKTVSYVEAVDILFRRVKNNVDALSEYMPAHEEDRVLTTITEILFKPYSRTLKAFACSLWIIQFVTLIALFWSMLPCPNQKIDWSVVIGLPLCCGYGE
jgi:hypothetical protein